MSFRLIVHINVLDNNVIASGIIYFENTPQKIENIMILHIILK